MRNSSIVIGIVVIFLVGSATDTSLAGQQWLQLKYDARHSGNVPERSVDTPLGLVGAIPLTDGIYTSPVVADDRIYAVLKGVGAAGKQHCAQRRTS